MHACCPCGMGGQPCDGCLDDRDCWVCLGTGSLEAPDGSKRPCSSCNGTGFCALCQASADPRVRVIYMSDRKPRDFGTPLAL